MTREIRITIDDDEVFERMKARKRELDLSWEEVLYRGLRETSPGPAAGPAESGTRTGPHVEGASPHREPAGPDPWDRWADDLEASIQRKVASSLRSGFGAAGLDVPAPPGSHLDEEVAALSDAEDAVLAFGFLPDEARFEVPLRVNIETSADGLAVEVVAVREGKDVTDANAFERGTRRDVAERLAGGDAATLRLAEGAEEYRVSPVLSWGRDEQGRPTVTDVEITDVIFDADE